MNRSKLLLAFVIGLLLVFESSRAATEVTILMMNTEFFFDHLPPHGQVVGSDDGPPVPTESEWKNKAQGIAQIIDSTGADLVGLVEVENETVVEEVRLRLSDPNDWFVIFLKGRDDVTGQDVALLTRFSLIGQSVTNFPDEREVYFVGDDEVTVNPSKILAAGLTIEGQEFYVIVAHLISRRGNNDAKRLAQASVIRRHAIMAMIQEQNVVVMGDMNDTPGTPAIRRLRGFDDVWGNFLQTANELPEEGRFTFVHQGQKNLLDHVLLSPSLYKEFRGISPERRCEIVDLGSLSDHHAVLARLKMQ
jgi:endonuclease/exonuclease/phosphatase family metal-dependent hydrolase